MQKRLQRSRKDVMLAGVCSGIAKYFNIDVTIVRGLWVLVALFGGTGVGAYIICAIVIPKEPKYSSSRHESSQRREAYDDQMTDDYDRMSDDELFDESYYETENRPYDEAQETSSNKDERSKFYLGIAMVALGGYMAFKVIFPGFSFNFFWPMVLIGVGLLILSKDKKREDDYE